MGKFRIFLAALLFLFCAYRVLSAVHVPTPATIDYYIPQDSPNNPPLLTLPTLLTLHGTIAEEPDVRRDKINYTIEIKSLIPNRPNNLNSPHRPIIPLSGYTLISANKYPKYEYGDEVEITGKLQTPPAFDTFDYAGYLSRFDIYSVMYRPKIKLLKNHNWNLEFGFWNLPLSKLLKLKASFESHLTLVFPTEPSSSFMAGLLLGSRKGMPEELMEDFQTTGLTHIIAISGYNITLVVSILLAIFKPLGRRTSLIISALGIIIFTIFVGASPAVVRACIMGLIALIALHSKRQGNISIILALTAAIMIGYNPKILRYDVGFQLSFLATMGLVYVSPILEKYLKWLPKSLAIRDSVNLSLSAQIMALPIIVLNFQNLSLISPLSNLLIAGPFIPLSMLFGFLGTILSYFYLPLAKIVAFPGYLLLEYIVYVIKLTADIPYAAITISWFSETMLILYFAILSLWLFAWWKQDRKCDDSIRQLQLFFGQRVVEHLWLKS